MGRMIRPPTSKSFSLPSALFWAISPKAYCHHVLRIMWLQGTKQTLSSLTKRENLLGRFEFKTKPQEMRTREAPGTAGVSVCPV